MDPAKFLISFLPQNKAHELASFLVEDQTQYYQSVSAFSIELQHPGLLQQVFTLYLDCYRQYMDKGVER
jgi:hypothetical protein